MRRNVTNKEVENNVQYLLSNMHMFNTTNNKLIITSPYDNVLSTNGLTYKVYYL